MKIKEKVLKIAGEFEEVTSREKLILDLTLAEVGKVINEGCGFIFSKFHKCGKMLWLCDRCRKLKQKLGIK